MAEVGVFDQGRRHGDRTTTAWSRDTAAANDNDDDDDDDDDDEEEEEEERKTNNEGKADCDDGEDAKSPPTAEAQAWNANLMGVRMRDGNILFG
ncbi:hypothetical protein PoB_002598300 [Plakobranchus ocellatus]|uniref:Uncharacterized protein n=1 Tax=Plakobranchus ocellatus TaxID=259542 RepID=A0AAV3ZYF7_9GAST|nr:hypothetical protein PoB_002598300 [Plakobranchus ocellatus]